MKCLNRAGIRNENGKKFLGKVITPLLTPLAEQGLVEMTSQGVLCHRETVELLIREAIKDKNFEPLAMAVQKELTAKSPWNYESFYTNFDRGFRDFRIAFYRKRNTEQLNKILNTLYDQHNREFQEGHPYERLLLNPFDEDMLMDLSPEVFSQFLIIALTNAFFTLAPAGYLTDAVARYHQNKGTLPEQLHAIHVLHLICRGEIETARGLLKAWPESSEQLGYKGLLSFLEGNGEESLQLYEKGLQLMRKKTRKKKVAYCGFAGLFHLCALLHSGKNENLLRAQDLIPYILQQGNHFSTSAFEDMYQLILFARGQKRKAQAKGHSTEYGEYYDYPSVLIAFLTLHWQGKKLPPHASKIFAEFLTKAENNGYHWFAKETAALQLAFLGNTKKSRKQYKDLAQLCPLPDICEMIQPKANWEHVLNALSGFSSTGGSTSDSKTERLVWLLEYFKKYDTCEIIPRLQKLSKNGKWTKGRAVALSTLYKNAATLSYLSSQDKRVVNTIEKDYESGYGYYGNGKTTYYFDTSLAIPALIGHPLLFLHNTPSVPMEIVKGAPELHVLKKKKGYEISLHPPLEDEKSYKIVQESPTRLQYIAIDEDFRKVADIVGSSVTVPASAKAKVLQALGEVSKVLTIHSDIGGGESADIKKVTADMRPHVHLLPFGEGLQVEVLNRPFRDGGSYYKPGSGGKTVMAEIDGRQLQTNRNLNNEKKNADAIIENCAGLKHMNSDDYEYTLEEPEECLELLTELQKIKEKVVIEWPKGESFQVMPESSFANFSMGIKRDNDWFGVTGSLQVDDKLTLDMKKLLLLTGNTENRFIQLDDGRFLALNNAFKKRLDELRAYSENHGKGVRLNPLAGLALEEFTEEVGSCKTDKHWKENIKRFQDITEPLLPSTLQAHLRDYQEEGFAWLSRLSTWNVGACLADDMGLGKTVQALAAILLRAPDGPTLIIAPTSVMMNWEDEAKRFAPTLSVLHFADGDRKKKIGNLAPFDIMICSYGLLQTEAELLTTVQWQTIVLDEAQAIKNKQTKRSKAAMALQANFRIITTGTPIENHLGELWNLFRFINPGLLGSYEGFKKKFAIPIEKYNDKEAARRLKKLIQPFILRRLKQDVLQELPSRTEVTMQVEMSPEESAMYEAQRQQALEVIAGEDNAQGGQHMQVLAEITRLRRFCCNPQLVVPDLALASSKLKVFTNIVQELLENNHKALVFSQFVGHLSLLRERLDSLGISYQYLDGSTPVKQRTKRVKDFQSGKGDLFLISLKAGGSGLNLTAADYVIHMDPWWNPAVEDQASDRAHRIGQQRPVTVYRLVVKGTIEEKIVALHKTKRDLADNLLDGSDMSGKISTKQLLALLKEG